MRSVEGKPLVNRSNHWEIAMHTQRQLFAATLVSLLMLSGCASLGAEALADGGGSGQGASDQEDILQVMERDSKGG